MFPTKQVTYHHNLTQQQQMFTPLLLDLQAYRLKPQSRLLFMFLVLEFLLDEPWEFLSLGVQCFQCSIPLVGPQLFIRQMENTSRWTTNLNQIFLYIFPMLGEVPMPPIML